MNQLLIEHCGVYTRDMTATRHGVEPPDDALLTERPVRAYLACGEELRATLTNVREGVAREAAGGATTVAPAADRGAVAAVTDERVLFAVGDPDEKPGDYAASVPHVEVGAVRTGDRAAGGELVVETVAGPTWRFPAREADALAGVADDLSERCARAHLERARDLAATGRECEDVAARIAALERAVTAYRCGARLDHPEAADSRSAREEAEGVIEDLLAAHLEFARQRRAAGNWDWEAGDERAAYDAFADARESFDRAVELAREFPVGDAEAVAAERDQVAERLASLSEADSPSA